MTLRPSIPTAPPCEAVGRARSGPPRRGAPRGDRPRRAFGAALALLLGCQPAVTPARWTAESALAPHRARLDTDHDGRVSAAEYDRTLWNGPPFPSVDRDGDGDLSAAELAALVQAESPTSFDGPARDDPMRRAAANIRLPSDAERDVWELLVWMGDAVRSRGLPGPDPAAVAAAVHSGDLHSAESAAVLGPLRAQWTSLGWTWPAGVP